MTTQRCSELNKQCVRPYDLSYGLRSFTQFVFDNADFNAATLTGHNTFHYMGGITCVTPPGSVNEVHIKREVKLQSAKIIGSFAKISIETYNKPAVKGLQSFTIEPLKPNDHEAASLHSALALNNLWAFGYVLHTVSCSSWSGFMKVVMTNGCYERSRIVTLSFINLDPSNLSTIYTTLNFAQTQCEKYGLRVFPVTFDQSLYIKSTEIVASTQCLDKVIMHLGGFHLLMSYLGSIGHIMTDNRLADLWESVCESISCTYVLWSRLFSCTSCSHSYFSSPNWCLN